MVVAGLLASTEVGLGAQNMHWEESGAYTGELSAAMIKEYCQFVIIGHSERRAYFGETDESVNKKVKAAIKQGLIPIVCVGETLEEYEGGRTSEVVTRQVKNGLGSIAVEDSRNLIVAYEPVWAIGTGKAASPEGANEVIGDAVRKNLVALFGNEAAQTIRILYGGSVNAANAADFFHQTEIDGGLVGGASLKAGDFVKIVEAAA
jgi:triosephosphate isomerase